MANFSLFLLALLFHSTFSCQSRTPSRKEQFLPSKELEVSSISSIRHRDTDEDVKNLQSASDILREASEAVTAMKVLQFFKKVALKAGEEYFGEYVQTLGKFIGMKSELQEEIEQATKLIIEIHSLHHSLHHQTHELKAYMDKLNFKDNVVVPLTMTYRAMQNFIKNPDSSTKEELMHMCRKYPPKAVAVHITQHAFDLLTNLYKASKFDGPLYDKLCSLLLKYFYTAQTIYFFKHGIQHSGNDTGASKEAREHFLKDQNLLEQNIKRATDNMHIDFVPFFNSSVNRQIIMPLTQKHESEENQQIAVIVYEKLRTKYNWSHFVVIVENQNEMWRGPSYQDGGIRYEGSKSVAVFLTTMSFHETICFLPKEAGFYTYNSRLHYYYSSKQSLISEERLKPAIAYLDRRCRGCMTYAAYFDGSTFNNVYCYCKDSNGVYAKYTNFDIKQELSQKAFAWNDYASPHHLMDCMCHRHEKSCQR